MGRSLRPWGLALGISLLLHGGLLASLGWQLPRWESVPEPALLEVQLVTAPEIPSPPRKPPTAKPLAAKPPAVRLPPPEPPLAPEPQLEPAAEAAAPAALEVASLNDAALVPVEAAAAPAPVAPAPPPLNPLPPRLDLRYRVSVGLASGEQTLLWLNEGGRYTLTSVAGATGFTGLFYRGRFVQTSRGRITPHGLRPEMFWDQRGDKLSSARFDDDNGTVTLLPAQGAPRHFAYQGDVQDVLSLFFQLALTAPPPNGQLTYTVFNGKKLRQYTYTVRGEETLETELGPLRTLHLERAVDGDGRFEAWLAIDRHFLPVRVLRSDDKGREAELNLQSMTP